MFPVASHDFITSSDITGALKRRWFRIACLTSFLTLCVFIILLVIPNRYRSEALLYVRMGRGTVSLDPTSTAAGQTISLMDRRQSEINSVREMLRSRIVLDRAVRAVGVERVLEHDAWWNRRLAHSHRWMEGTLYWLQDEWLKKSLVEEPRTPPGLTPQQFVQEQRAEEAVRRLEHDLDIDSAKESYTLGVSVVAYTPEVARELCDAVVNEYRKLHVEAHSLQGTLQFFDAEFALCDERLVELESQLRDEKNRAGMMTIAGKQDLIHQEMRQVQQQRIEAGSQLAAAQARDVEIASKIATLPEKLDLEKTAGIGNAATDAMRNQLFELEMIEKELVSKFAADHPLVVQVQQKLREAQNIFDEQEDQRVQSRQALNPIRQELELDRLRNLSALEGWRAQSEELNNKLTAAQAKAARLNSDEPRINELERDVQLARGDVMMYGRKREEARLLQQLDIGNFSDISVPQQPMLVFKHVAPQRSLLLAIGTVGSLVVSCCLAVWKEAVQNNRSENMARHSHAGLPPSYAQPGALVSAKYQRPAFSSHSDPRPHSRTASRASSAFGETNTEEDDNDNDNDSGNVSTAPLVETH